MHSNYKPDLYNSVSPYFIVDDVPGFIRFLETVFDAAALAVYRQPDGSVMHAEFRIDDSVIMLSNSTETYPATRSWIHVYVPDARLTYRKAVDFGCESLQAPVQKDDPDLRGTFRDPSGNFWAVGTKTS